jgi:hypothetical protein
LVRHSAKEGENRRANHTRICSERAKPFFPISRLTKREDGTEESGKPGATSSQATPHPHRPNEGDFRERPKSGTGPFSTCFKKSGNVEEGYICGWNRSSSERMEWTSACSPKRLSGLHLSTLVHMSIESATTLKRGKG